jgi:serine/threonine protein kinase
MTVSPVVVNSRYRLGRTLGEGGMGRVWLARDEVLGRDVAVKEIIPPDDLVETEHAKVQERSLREARAAARLSHPNVARVFDVFEADGHTWIVMEYIPSRTLAEAIRDDGPLPPRRVAEIGLEVLAALEASHQAGVRHRDVKPANILLGDDGRVVLTDFGIAAIEGDGIVTSADMVVGSPQFMSPERLRDGTAALGSDLWSLGASLYTAVEGHSPYERKSTVETLTAVAVDEPDPAHQPGPLAPVLEGLLRKDPAQRIGLPETRRLLRRAASVSPVRRPGRKVALAAAVVVAVMLAAGTAVWLGRRTETTTASPPPAAVATTAPVVPSPSALSPSPTPPSRTPESTVTTTVAAGNTRPPLPNGWRDYRDPTGFRLYVPEGWNRSKEGSIVYFRDPDTGTTLGIDQTNKPRPNPVADWQGKAEYRVGRGEFPGYREIKIKAVKYWQKAADWEYTFNGSTRQHVNNRGVITSKKQAYGIYWQTSDSRWKAQRPKLDLIFASFRPDNG